MRTKMEIFGQSGWLLQEKEENRRKKKKGGGRREGKKKKKKRKGSSKEMKKFRFFKQEKIVNGLNQEFMVKLKLFFFEFYLSMKIRV